MLRLLSGLARLPSTSAFVVGLPYSYVVTEVRMVVFPLEMRAKRPPQQLQKVDGYPRGQERVKTVLPCASPRPALCCAALC